MEEINKDAGWYDRNKNGKQHNKREADIHKTAEFLKGLVAGEHLIEVGGKAADVLKISKVTLVKALEVLKGQGYKIYFVPTEKTYEKVNVTTGEKKVIKVAMKVLAAPGTSFQTVFKRREEVFLALGDKNKLVPKGVPNKKNVKKRPPRPTRKNVIDSTKEYTITIQNPITFTESESQEDILARLQKNLGMTGNKENV